MNMGVFGVQKTGMPEQGMAPADTGSSLSVKRSAEKSH
jgi:hypothetical protein